MLRDIQKRFVLIHFILMGIFASGVGLFWVASTLTSNSAQLRCAMFWLAWEGVGFGVPLIVLRPLFRSVERAGRALEAGDVSAEDAAKYHHQILAYPFKEAIVSFTGILAGFALGALQSRYFARLPWEGVVITLICGVSSGLLWTVVEYFLVEHCLRPLTELAVSGRRDLPAPPMLVSLRVKIFASSLALVITALGFFGVVAYTRTTHTIEQEIGARISGRLRELANLVAALPQSADRRLSDSWWLLAAEFPISPQGYLHVVDPAGNVLATHPASVAAPQRLQDEPLLPEVTTQVLTEPEGYVTDRVGESRIVSFVSVAGTRWKLVAIAPLRDFNPQLNQLLYSGLAGMTFALALALGIGFLCARSITTSLAEVTRVAQLVAEKHDLTQRVTFQTNDEIGVLAHAFNQMAQGLQTYAGGLEYMVAERTQLLEQRTEQLATKNAELSDFLYIASHDLRAPLINLAGFSHALQDGVANLDGFMSAAADSATPARVDQWREIQADIGESLDFILRSVAKMDLLVNAVLELSRIENRPHVAQPVDTAKIVADILAAFNFQIAEKKIAVRAGALPWISGDPVRVGQIFSNLIDNAIKYMPQRDDARIEIGCEEQGDMYRFFVRDTGKGIRPEDQDKVFRLFTRLGAQTVAGDGVGLAAIRKIIDRHGGRIWVESEIGVGSTFWFTLPRAHHTEPAAVASDAA